MATAHNDQGDIDRGHATAPVQQPEHHGIVSCPVCGQRNRVPVIATGRPRCGECHSDLPWTVDADAATFDAAIAGPGLVLVDFWAPWCGPCGMIAPILETLAVRYAGRLKVVKLEVDTAPALAARHGAQSIPLLVLFADGAEVERVIGAHPEPHLDAVVQRALRATPTT